MNELFGLPLCKCGHEAEQHDDEFGTCGGAGLNEAGWDICECEGYEEGEYEKPTVIM